MDDRNRYGFINRNNNDMTTLLNRIQRKLIPRFVPLPEGLRKDDWPQIIYEETIPTFSLYIPYSVTEIITPDMRKDGFFFIDQHLPEGSKILGIVDIDWQSYKSDMRFDKFGVNINAQTWMTKQYALDDVAMTAVGTDMISLFNLGIYPIFKEPNKIRLENVSGTEVSLYRPFPLKILLEHPGLHTISRTMMDTFTELAMADIAIPILNELRYYDNFDTQFATLNLVLTQLEEAAGARPEIINKLKEASVSASNSEIPLLMTI